MFNGIRDWFLGFVIDAFKGFDSMLSSSQTVLTQTNDSVWSSVLELSNVLKPFCYTIIGICLLIELAQVASKVDIIKWEHGLKLLVKMVLAKVCIDIAPTVLKACYIQAAEWITSIGTGTNTNFGTSLSAQVEPLLKNVSGAGNILALFAASVIVIVAIKVCGLLIQVIAFGRMFELYVYLAVSPLPCAFFPLGDGSGGGFSRITGKFFKSFVAVCLQGVMIILCMRIFNLIIGGTLNQMIQNAINSGSEPSIIVGDLCYVMLLGAIVLLMSIVRCGSWAKSILDVM